MSGRLHTLFLRHSFFLTLACTSCTVGPIYSPPEMDIPCTWNGQSSEEIQTNSCIECFNWWASLNDPLLSSLIQQAAEQNLDLSIAGLRVLEARAVYKGKTSERYPQIYGSFNAGYIDCNKNELLRKELCQKKKNWSTGFFELGFDAEWEIDLFGVQAHETNAFRARMEASEEELDWLWVTLSAEIAKNYIELRGFQQHLNILNERIAIQKDITDLTVNLLKIGMNDGNDLAQAQVQLGELEAQKPLIELSIEKSIHRLSILLGYAPGEMRATLVQPQQLPERPFDQPLGVPSELLRRRRDIRKEERNLAAATEEIGSAVASLFPRLSLRGFVGGVSACLESLLKGNNLVGFAGSQLLVPIFNSRELIKDIDLSKIKKQEALYNYQKTVLEALLEVENAIAALHFEMERNQHLAHAVQLSQQSYQSTLKLYEKGLYSYIEVQNLNHKYLLALDADVQGQVELLLNYIALYKALGGEWQEPCNN